ncbi:MAG: hypothetical protein HY744_00530 [Deltaproteobacteria bacterium]|nr:hypothetical protein [Deltaproteobacteria bacterium]
MGEMRRHRLLGHLDGVRLLGVSRRHVADGHLAALLAFRGLGWRGLGLVEHV